MSALEDNRVRAEDETSVAGLLPARLVRLIPALACPHCRGSLEQTPKSFRCTDCGKHYAVRKGKIYFIEPLSAEDTLDSLKLRLKRLLGSSYYTIGVNIIAPAFPFNYGAAIRKYVNPVEKMVVDLGCGNNRVSEDIATLDANDYDAADIVASLEALPFKDSSIDVLCSRSVLEHVPDLMLAASEIIRCTRPNGIGIHSIPFMYPFHASPYDFHRVTNIGAARLFLGWDLLEQRSTTGPVSLFLICLNEFVASLVSMGNTRVKAPIYLMMCLFTFPFKFFDVVFVGRKSFIGLAPTILTVVRKP
jgi:SAM-dependent methyltransferase